MVGIKETTELLVGVNELALVIIKQLNDGLQLGMDVMGVIEAWQNDATFHAAVTNAAAGVKNIPEELNDIDTNEAITLAIIQLQYVPRIIGAARKT